MQIPSHQTVILQQRLKTKQMTSIRIPSLQTSLLLITVLLKEVATYGFISRAEAGVSMAVVGREGTTKYSPSKEKRVLSARRSNTSDHPHPIVNFGRQKCVALVAVVVMVVVVVEGVVVTVVVVMEVVVK